MGKFKKVFRGLRDPRAANTQHELLEVLFIALAATLCGAACPSDMAQFGRAKEGLLRQVLRLEHGIPICEKSRAGGPAHFPGSALPTSEFCL